MVRKVFGETGDPGDWTSAAVRAEDALNVPIGLMGFASDERGRPKKEQRYLYLAALTFTYAVWESYVEDLAIEAAGWLSERLPNTKIPPAVKDRLSGSTAWELAVDPGWRALWLADVEAQAKGAPGAGYGINTASFDNVSALFGNAGIEDALPVRLSVEQDTRIGKFKNPPSKVAVKTGGGNSGKSVDVKHCLNRLISLRGEAVHTAKTSDTLLKNEVLWWTGFIRDLHEEVDTLATKKIYGMLSDGTA